MRHAARTASPAPAAPPAATMDAAAARQRYPDELLSQHLARILPDVERAMAGRIQASS